MHEGDIMEEQQERKSVTIVSEAMEARKSEDSDGSPTEQVVATTVEELRCKNCGYNGPCPTAWRNDILQLWIMCPRCGKGIKPLRQV